LVCGLVLLGYLVYRVGPSVLLDQLLRAGWGFAGVVAVALLSIVVMAIGWKALLAPGSSRANVWELAGASIVGAAINFITPGSVGGEPVKAALLKNKVPAEELVSTVLLHNVVYWVSNLLLIISGAAVALLTLSLPSKIVWLLIGATLGVALPVVAGAWLIHKGMAERFLRLVQKVGIKLKNGEELMERARKADVLVREFSSSHPRAFYAGFFWVFLGRAFCILEVYVILLVMGYSVSASTVFLIQTTSLIVYIAFAFIPSQLGANEGASYFLFPYVGLTAGAGVAMEMLRRLRVVALVALGLALLGVFSLKKDMPKPSAVLEPPTG
jgi:uncharacterized protein (TIRG00374 family)